MKVNFSELLASERVRPLWGRSFTPESAMDELQQILGQDPSFQPQGSATPGGPVGLGGAGAPATAGRAATGAQTGSARGMGTSAPGAASEPTADGASARARDGHGSGHGADEGSSDDAAGHFVPPPDLADLPIRPPQQIFEELEQAVRGDLGNRACMVRNFLEALRVRVHALDPSADEALYHPLRHAAGGSLWELLSRMEDTLSGLRRVAAGR